MVPIALLVLTAVLGAVMTPKHNRYVFHPAIQPISILLMGASVQTVQNVQIPIANLIDAFLSVDNTHQQNQTVAHVLSMEDVLLVLVLI